MRGAGREFAKIGASLFRSRKFASLKSDRSRLAYIALHLTPLGNFQGIFWLPPAMLASDLGCDAMEAQDCLIDLADAGLIDLDAADEIVRITGWHLKANAPYNQARALARLRELDEIPGPPEMRRATVAELFLAIGRKIAGWNPEAQITDELHREFMKQFRREASPDLAAALAAAGYDPDIDEITGTMIGQFLPAVMENGMMPPLSGDDAGTVTPLWRHIEREKEREIKREKRGRERERARGRVARAAAPAREDIPPALDHAAAQIKANAPSAIMPATPQDIEACLARGLITEEEAQRYERTHHDET